MNKVIVARAGELLGIKIGDSVVIQLGNGDVWHGKMKDLMVLDADISHLIPLTQAADHEQRLVESISKLIRTGKIVALKVD